MSEWFHQMRFSQTSIGCPSGGCGEREAGDTVVESLIGCLAVRARVLLHVLVRSVSTRFGEGGG